ncbi:unnamed protein product, partial [Rotaria sp. Silwood1]
MDGKNSKEANAHSTTDATASTTASSVAMMRRERMAENYLVIWVDETIDPNNEHCQQILAELRGVVNQINLCTTTVQCVQWLNESNEETSFLISSGAFGQKLVPDIHEMPKLDAIYIFCTNTEHHEQWAKNWTKIK